jgi:hypothetical protein
MATDIKTIPWVVHTTATAVANNTLTALGQITMYLPEFTGTVTFKNVTLVWYWDDQITATGGSFTTKRLDVSLGGGTATTYSNANTVTNSGENISGIWTVDATSQFASQWTSGTSKTLDVSVLINITTGTTLTTTNHTVVAYVTYEYDDTQPTQIKAVYEPLNAATAQAITSFVTRDTFPALDTFLPEASKTYRQVTWWLQGNETCNGSTTTDVVAIIADTSNTLLTVAITNALATDRFTVIAADASSLSKNNTHTFGYTSSISRRYHQQAWAIIVYEFDASASNNVRNSVLLPVVAYGSSPGTASSDALSFPVELDIQEPGPISDGRVAFFMFWGAIASGGTISARVGTGSYVSYGDVGGVFAGANALMVRNDSAYTLVRGINRLNAQVYASAPNNTAGFCGFWMVSYTSGKASGGHGAHTKTRFLGVMDMHPQNFVTTAGIAHQPSIPQSSYRLVNAGVWALAWTSSTNYISGIDIAVERLSSEQGGAGNYSAFPGQVGHDQEVGVSIVYGSLADYYWRWANDPDARRVNPKASRNWRFTVGASNAVQRQTIMGIVHLLTYHAITYTVSGTIYGSAGGTVTIDLHRSDTGEKVATTTRSGNGAYSLTWYDDTVDVYVVAYEAAGRLGRSKNGKAGTDTLDVVLGPRLGHVSQTRVGARAP